jgi:hypothetical protein
VIEDLRGDVAYERDGFKKAEPHWRAFVAAKPRPNEAVSTYAKLARSLAGN